MKFLKSEWRIFKRCQKLPCMSKELILLRKRKSPLFSDTESEFLHKQRKPAA